MGPAARLACALLLALAAAAGCGREDDAATPTSLADLCPDPAPGLAPDAASDPAPVAAYRAWLDALAARNAAAACARHAPELTIDLRRAAILLDRAELGDPCTAFVAVLWEQPDREYDPIGIEATQVTDEDALLAVDLPGRDQTVRVVNQDTRWLVASSVPRTDATDAADPNDTTAPQRWLAAWCDLELQMSPAELTARMGAPSGTYTVVDGGDYDRLTASERAALTCAELR